MVLSRHRLGECSAGAALLAIGMFWLSGLKGDSAYSSLVAGMIVLGVGIGFFYSSLLPEVGELRLPRGGWRPGKPAS